MATTYIDSDMFRYTITYTVSSTNTQTTITISSIAINNISGGTVTVNPFELRGTNPSFTQIVGNNDTKYTPGQTRSYTINKTYSATRGKTASSFVSKVNVYQGVYIDAGIEIPVQVPAKPSYTISYNANGGSGQPGNQTKWYDENITLSSAKPSRSGWSFSKWNTNAGGTGTDYNPGQQYTTNAALNLYAQWTRVISSVSIGSIAAIRTDDESSTTPSDSGRYGYITVPYTVSGAAAANVTLSVTVTADHGSVPTITIPQGSASKNVDATLTGTFIARASGLDPDGKYTFTATVSANNTSTTQTVVKASKSVIILSAYYTMSVFKGGMGVSFGAAARENIFNVSMPLYHYENVFRDINGNVSMGIIDNSRVSLKMNLQNNKRDVLVAIDGTNSSGAGVLLGAGGLTIVGSGESVSSLYNVLGVAPGNENLHLCSDTATYVYSNCNTIADRKTWIFAANGALAFPGVAWFARSGANADAIQMRMDDLDLTTASAATSLSAARYWTMARPMDKNSNWVGTYETYVGTAGNVATQIQARRWSTSSKALVSNYLRVNVNADGNQTYAVANPTNFRVSIGAHNASNLSDGTVPRARIENTNWAYLSGSASSTDKYTRWRMVAGIVFVEWYWDSGASTTTGGVSYGTIPNGYRPSKRVEGTCYTNGNDVAWYDINTNGVITVGTRSTTTKTSCWGSASYPLG